jgi:hypothetical protein
VGREPADLLGDVGSYGREGVVVARLDPHDPRRLRGTEAHGEDGPERDRHLAEDVARATHTDDALDPVDELDRLDATLEHGEERALAALVRRVLARHEADVRRHPRELLTLRRVESREERDLPDLLRRHHARQPRRRTVAEIDVRRASTALE